VDGDPTDVIAPEFDLSGVESDTDLKAESRHTISYGLRAADGACWAIENGEGAVARRLDRSASEPLQLMVNKSVVGDLEIRSRRCHPTGPHVRLTTRCR
jgi:hypothetical protein